MNIQFRNVLLMLLLFLSPQLAISQSKPKREMPKYERSIEGIKEFSLSNGLQILLIPDNTQSNVIVNIVYKVGSRHEGYGETGMAHLLEHMLFKSTKKLGDIKKMLSDKGGNANGTTWYDRTNYYEIFPSNDENLRWSIEMEADRMINATILQSDLDKEFSVVRNEFEIGENDPSSILSERIISTAYLWHNYGNSTIGSREDIERVKAETLRRFYEKYYQPDNAVLIIAGKFDEAKALNYVADYFSIIPRPKRVLEKTYTVEPPQDGERFVELRRNGDVQYLGAMYHTAALADKDYAAISVLLEILDADPSGYLYKALVESQKASSVYAWQPELHAPGFTYFGVEVPKDKSLEEARKTFLDALDAIATTQYTEEDLKRGKAKQLKALENQYNNTMWLSIGLAEYIGAGDYRLYFLRRDETEKVTLDDVKRVAAYYFKTNNRTWGQFIPSGNEERVKPREFSDEDIQKLTSGYKGKEVNTSSVEFERSIKNIKAHMTEKQLPNGMRYVILQKPIKGEKVMGSFKMQTGDAQSLMGLNYVADLTASMLKSGTRQLTKEQIQDKLDEMKSSLSFFWSGQSLTISFNTYEKYLPEMMELIRQCIMEPQFPQNELEKIKLENKAYYESQLNDPQSIAFTTLAKKTENYPKGHIYYTASPQESIEGEKSVTREQIINYYQSFLGSNHGFGTIIGNIDASKIEPLMMNTFNAWNTTKPFRKESLTHFETKYFTERIQVNDKENATAAAAITFVMNQQHPDYPALMMANEMLGSGGFLTSRIPTRLREKEGISYGAGSYLNVRILQDASEWGAYAMFNPTKVDKVESALKEEIANAIDKGFTAEELKTSIVSWQNERNTSLGNDGMLISMINASLETSTDLDRFDKLEADVKKLTVEQVNVVIRKYLSMDKLVLIMAGDFNKK